MEWQNTVEEAKLIVFSRAFWSLLQGFLTKFLSLDKKQKTSNYVDYETTYTTPWWLYPRKIENQHTPFGSSAGRFLYSKRRGK